MNRSIRLHGRWLPVLVTGLALGAAATGAPGARAATYDLGWSNVAGGGGTFSTGGAYQLGGSIGQPDAGTLAGGVYGLRGGFFVPVPNGLVAVPPDELVPRDFVFRAANPNPFSGSTSLAFEVPRSGNVALALFSVDGRRVRTLLDEERGAGRHVVLWDGRDDAGRVAAPGVYLARLTAGAFVASRRLVHLD